MVGRGEFFRREIYARDPEHTYVYRWCLHFLFESPHSSLSSPLPSPILFLLFLAGGGTKSGRGRRHKSLNPSPKGSGPLSLSLFHRFFIGFSFLRPWRERRGGGIEIALFFPSEFFLDSRRRMSMFEKKFSRYGL